AMGKRRDPLLFACTNSGYDRHSVCWKQREYSMKVLDSIFEDDSWFAWISGIDDEDNWEDEKNWVKASPRLGTIVSLDDMQQQARFFLPKEGIVDRVKRDRVPYDVWEREGLFTLTEGRVIDYKVIRAEINDLARQVNIREIVFDRWNSSDIVTELEGDGFEMV